MENCETSHRLTAFGIRPSPQRMAVYAYLCERKNHPTVDAIYRDLSPDYPSLSRTTVYNTLKLFLDRAAVQPILIEDGELRYDADMRVHAHFKCRKCGEVYDLFLDGREVLPALPEGFRAEETHLYYRGCCPDCGEAGR